MERDAAHWLRAAEDAGGARLATLLREVLEETRAETLPVEICGLTGHSRSFVIPPRSYRMRLFPALRRQAMRLRERLAGRRRA